ncbi:hypothetical protein Q428_00040 [Fervidicella metallireducens AeB]|uniref:Protein from nitrogen regulatory protein P-II n=1 Tax=Fervidicella metallireducens AeB TaxID=1403537 RepID=A0A017RYS4_9CLOT|nr:cyclic-di-AMP receptor [Fervidicella metallireducens]EYE89746.1 hypothetical protein Q428_00040 [Fervidicella metallireducens AeB]
MKLVIAIVHDDDAGELIKKITRKGFGVTKLATTGGFLKAGNTTLLIGVEKEKVEEVLDIIRKVCTTRKQIVSPPSPVLGATGVYVPNPVEITIGGATVFVIDVDKFEKV